MKRTPLRRRTQLRRVPFMRRPTARSPELDAAKRHVYARSNGVCEAMIVGVCTYRAREVHHVLRRSQGGTDHPDNLVDLCPDCHRWVHANPAAAYEAGLLRRNGTAAA